MTDIGMFMWVVTAASLIGVIANIKKKRWCFGIWFFTNSSWAIYDFIIGAWAQSALMTVYALLAIWGIYEWRTVPVRKSPIDWETTDNPEPLQVKDAK